MRAQVPQGVLPGSLSALRWRLATGAVRRRLRCAPLSALPRHYPLRQTPASVCRWRPVRALCSAPDRASSRLLLQLCGLLCPRPSRSCQHSTVESLNSGAGASSSIRPCELGCQVPPWPNGQGVGPLIRRLRAQVPQGVLSVSLSALRWRLATGAVRRRLRCAPLSALPRPCPPRQTPASVCRWRPARAVAVPQTGPPLGCCCSSVASCALGHLDIANAALWSLSALVLVHLARYARVN